MTRQEAFHAALLDPALPVPDGLTDGAGRAAGRRYAVYRNNVAVSLREALAQGFPAIVSLLGQENFDHVARAYLRAHPPDSPVMMRYGAGFPDFLAALPQLAQLPYLACVARLDLGLRQSYHAADSDGMDPACLQGLDEARLARTGVALAPSLVLLRSPYPVASLRAYALGESTAKPAARAEDVAILRAAFDPEAHLLGPGMAETLLALQDGRSLGAAIDAGGADLDLAGLLTLLLAHQAITALT